jgi:hypothetical protein
MIRTEMKIKQAKKALFVAAGICAAAFLTMMAAWAATVPHSQEAAGAAGREIVELQSNERQLYPRLEAVAIRSIDRLSDGVGASLALESDRTGFSHFLYSINGEPFRKTDGGRLVISFVDKHTPDIQRTTTIIKAASADGGTSEDHYININYYPREHYAKAAQTAPGYVILQKTDIPFAQSRIADWIVDQASAEDIAFATSKWGPKLEGLATPLEKARRLAMLLLDDLQPHRGTPSDKMKAPPFEQYRRAVSGEDHVWCGNLAAIFVRACTSLGIPARAIGMNRTVSEGKAYNLMTAEGHSTTEIFAADLNKWVWIDLTFMMTGMELPGRGPIHMADLLRALNDPDQIGGLTALVYDPAQKTETRVSVLGGASRDALLNYFKNDQTFRYVRKTN